MTTRSVNTASRDVVAYRELLLNLIRRELRSRFRRSFLGWGWSFMQPLLMTAVYAVVLGVFLKAEPAPGDPSGIDSFAFDSGAMVREMLFHLTRPPSAVLPGRGAIELVGRVERK